MHSPIRGLPITAVMRDEARAAWRGLGEWLAQRAADIRAARAAREAQGLLGAMSERELRDIGLSRADIERVARMQASRGPRRPEDAA